MNKLYKYAALLGIVAVGFTSCDDDDLTGKTSVTPTNPTVTIDGPADINVSEAAGEDFIYTITLSEPQVTDVVIDITQLNAGAEGSATLGEDFKLSTNQVIIPSYTTTGKFTLSTVPGPDDDSGAETIQLQIGGETTANAQINPMMVNATITDVPRVLQNGIDVTVAWDGDYSFVAPNGEVVEGNFCDEVDLDIYFFTEEKIAEPISWAESEADVNGYALASSSCPEAATVEDLADGTYYIYAALYADAIPDLGDLGPLDIPVTVSVSRSYDTGTLAGEASFTQEDNFLSSDSPNATAAGYVASKLVGIIVVENDTYTLQTPAGEVVESL